ncbi:MAG: protein adenylyltransferase SelO family protein, partial [Bdellovibrionota bacterium]
MSSLTDLQFQNYFTSTFAGDTTNDLSSRSTPQVLYALAKPTPVKNPKILAWSHDLAKRFNLDQPETQGETAALLTGNLVTLSMKPYAACYGGHQFGHWADQLGDGRAITLGELTEASSGERYDLQLKGAGRTAYSRRADGRAVLRSSLREYIASEALHFLGVPTTRALSLSLTGDQVLRDMFYDGHAK